MLQMSPPEPASLTSPRALICLGLLLTLTAAIFIQANAPWYEGYYFWSILGDVDQKGIYALFGIFGLALLAHSRLTNKLAKLPDIAGRYPWQISITSTLILALLARYAYLDTPFTMDEYSPWFQAHIFASGHLSAPFPVDLIDHVISPVYRNHFFAINQHNGQTISTYWPGFALLMTPFAWLGAPWLTNPVIVGINLLVAWRLGCDVFGTRRAGGWVLLLMLASPAVTLNGISYYSMPAHLLFNTLFVWLLLEATPVRYFLAGLAGAMACSLHNPFPHLAFALPWFFWALSKGRLQLLLVLALGYVLIGAPLLLGWSIFKAPFIAATLAVDKITGLPAAMHAIASPPPASLLDNLIQIMSGLFTYPSDYLLLARSGALVKLWAWSCPLLIPLAVYGFFSSRLSVLRYLAASAIITLLIYYFIRFDQGMGWGYRYFHSAYIALPMLATAALLRLEQSGPKHAQWRNLAPALVLSSGLILTPVLAYAMQQRIVSALSERPPQLTGRGLYILNGKGECQGLRCDLLLNAPFLRGDVYLFNRQRDKVPDSHLLQHFPGAEKAAENQYGRSYRLPD